MKIDTPILSNLLIGLPFTFGFSLLTVIDNPSHNFTMTVIISLLASLVLFKKRLSETIAANWGSALTKLTLAFTVYICLIYSKNNLSSAEIRTLVSLTVLALIFPYQDLKRIHVQTLAILAASVMTSNTLYYQIYLDQGRWTGGANPIPYATVAAAILLLNVFFAATESKTRYKIIHGIATFGLLLCVVASQTRGVWIALPCSLYFLCRPYIGKLSAKQKLIGISVALLAVFALGTQVTPRLEKTISEIDRVVKGDLDSSIGLRLQLWSVAPNIVSESVLTGIGRNHQDYFSEQARNRAISDKLLNYQLVHFHNQLIDALVRIGIIGLIFYLCFYVIPLYLSRGMSMNSRGLLYAIVTLYAIAGLTDTPLTNTEPLILYFLLVSLLTRDVLEHEQLRPTH